MFEPSLSTSAMRPPLSADVPSMADTLPSINFGFEDLRDRMARFTARFDDFIEKGRKRVLEERNQFRMNVAELQGAHISANGFLFGESGGNNKLLTHFDRGPAHEEA
jgi:kinetochore protein Spc25